MLFNLSQKIANFPTTKAKYRKTSVKILLELLLLSNIYPEVNGSINRDVGCNESSYWINRLDRSCRFSHSSWRGESHWQLSATWTEYYGTTQVSSALVERHAARPGACFHLSDIKPGIYYLVRCCWWLSEIVKRVTLSEQFFIPEYLPSAHSYYCNNTSVHFWWNFIITNNTYPFGINYFMDLYDCSGLLIKISQNQFTRKSGKLYDHLNYTLTDDQELINMYRAADHRRAELVSGGRLFDLGQVPKSVWHYVQ